MSGLVQSSRTSLTSPLYSTGRRARFQCPRLCGVPGNPTMPATPRIMSCCSWNKMGAKCASMITRDLFSLNTYVKSPAEGYVNTALTSTEDLKPCR